LRSALSVFAPLLPKGQVTHFRAESAWASAALSAARDWDVFATELLPELDGRLSASGHARLEALVELKRVEAYVNVADALRSRRFATLALQLTRWRSRREWRDQPLSEMGSRLFAPVDEFADTVLRKRDRNARRRGRHLAQLTVAQRHELRIVLKKLRYNTDFFRSLYPGEAVKAYLKRLQKLQDLFGHLNDVAQIEHFSAMLAQAGRSPETAESLAFLSGWHARGVAEMEDELRRAWRRFEAVPPFWET
jgi:triphosphatase